MQNLRTAVTMLAPRRAAPPIADSRVYFEHLGRVVAKLPYRDIEEVTDLLHEAYRQSRSVFLFGNGGSAALASHFACDLGKGTAAAAHDKRFRVLSLTDNVPLMTAWANDSSYEHVFAEQLCNFIHAKDVAIGISASGRSPNVLLALQAARDAGAITVGLTGFEGGKMPAVCDTCVIIPSDNMQIIEDMQLGIAHSVFAVLSHRISNPAFAETTSSIRAAA